MSLPITTRAVGLNESIEAIVAKINRRGLNLKVNATQFTQPLGRITDKANEFTKSLEASNARVIAFGASAAIIGGVGKTFEQLVVQAVKFEKIMTDINVVLNTTASNLEKFGSQLFGVAKNTSQALDVAAEAALEFSRQGLSMEETLKRTNDALILTRLTGMKAADAVKSLTAAVNGFADAGITTSAIINKMAAVDVKFAVSADDLANALARAGAVAQDAGVSFDQLIAAVTSAQQITARGGNVIGNSFKTIFTRIQRSSTLNQLERLGVAVRDLRGDTLPAMRVLTNLAKTYDTLTASQKASTAEAVGGVFQINILKAGMKDLAKTNSLYSQALDVSTKATDQAYKKNEMLQKTLSALAAQTSLSFQELAKNIGQLSLAPGISGILTAVNSAVEGLNDMLGKDADGMGSEVAKGFVKGFGKVLTGPGMVLALGIFGKLFFSALRFAKQSLKDVLGVVTAKDKEKKIQDAIVEAMQDNKTLAIELNKYAGDKVKQEKIILGVIQEQTDYLDKQRKIAATLAPGLARKGVSGSLTLPSAATGLVPNFAKSPSAMDRIREKSAAQKGGYAAGSVRSLDMPGLGRVVYNSAEEVRKIPGMRQPAIMPPPNSSAGYQYRSDFRGKHGYNPYDNGFTSDNNSGGFLPNFANQRLLSQYGYGPSKAKSRKLPSGSVLSHRGNEIDWMQSNQRGEGHEMFNSFLNEKGTVTSESLKQNRSFKQGSKTNFEDLMYAFPQLQYRLKSNAVTTGRFTHGPDRKSFRFQGLRDLKGRVNTMNREGFRSALGAYPGMPGMDIISVGDLTTTTTKDKRKADNIYKNYAGGSIPNFATLMGNTLRLGPSPTKLVGGANFRNRKLDKAFEHSVKTGAPMYLESPISQIAGKRGSNNAYLHDVLGGLSKRGIQNIGRNFFVQGKARTTRMKRLPGETADEMQERATIGARHKAGQKGYFSTGGKRGDKNFPVDAIGRGLRPLEVKDGQIDKHNVLQKSLRLYSDSELLRFASQYPELNAKISSANQAHRGKAERLLAGKGVLGKGYSYDEAEESILAHHIGGGFIPNFADKELVKSIGRVIDGDSVVGNVYLGTQPIDHRLQHVDAVESSQKFGGHARRIAQKYYKEGGRRRGLDADRLGKPGRRSTAGASYGRGLFEDSDLANELISRGYGIPDFRYATGQGRRGGMIQLVQQARKGQRGIWRKGNEKHPKRLVFESQMKKLGIGLDEQLGMNIKGSQVSDSRLTQKITGFNRGANDPYTGRKGRKGAGFIPNFADPLTEAIGREGAAGVSKSMMRLEQDDSLAGRGNPFGLAITNTRDEPNGIKQGIRRAKGNNVDPKKHGIPNYAAQSARSRAFDNLKDSARGGGPAAAVNTELQGMQGLLKGAGDTMGKFDMQLMGLTTATYFLEGAFEDAESTMGRVMGAITASVQGLSQGAQLFSMGAQVSTAMNTSVATNTAAGGKWTKAGGGLRGAAKGGMMKLGGAFSMLLGPVGLLLGVLPPIISHFKLFQSASERAAEKLAKVTANLEGLDNVLTMTKETSKDGMAIRKLETLGGRRSVEQNQKLMDLQIKSSERRIKMNTALSKLTTGMGLTTDQQKRLNGSLEERIKLLNELKNAELKKAGRIVARKTFAEQVDFYEGMFSSEKSHVKHMDDQGKGELVENAANMWAANLFSQLNTEALAETWEKKGKSKYNNDVGDFGWGPMSGDSAKERRSNFMYRTRKRTNAAGGGSYAFMPRRENQHVAAQSYMNQLTYNLRQMGGMNEADEKAMNVEFMQAVSAMEEGQSRGVADVYAGDEANAVMKLVFATERQMRARLRAIAKGTSINEEMNALDEEKAAALQEGLRYLINTQMSIKKSQFIEDQKLKLQQEEVGIIQETIKQRIKVQQKIIGSIGGDEAITRGLKGTTTAITDKTNIENKEAQNKVSRSMDAAIMKVLSPKGVAAGGIASGFFDAQGGGQQSLFDSMKNVNKRSSGSFFQRMGSGITGTPYKHTNKAELGVEKEFEQLRKNLERRNRAGDKILTREEVVANIQGSLTKLKTAEEKNYFVRMLNDARLLATSGDQLNILTEANTHAQSMTKLQQQKNNATARNQKKSAENAAEASRLDQKTVKGGEKILSELRSSQQISEDVGKTYLEQLKASKIWLLISKHKNDAELDALKSVEGMKAITDRGEAFAGDKIIQDELSLKNKIAENKAYNDLLRGSQALVDLTVDNHIERMNQLDTQKMITEANIKLYESTDALANEVTLQLDLERQKRKEADMRARETHNQKMKAGDFADEERSSMRRNIEGLSGRDAALRFKMATYRNQSTQGTSDGAGNLTRLSAANVEYASNLKTMNEELNTGTLAWDSIRVKIAEADDRAARFAETLANTSFDAVRDGFSTMFSELADGTKKTSLVMLGFVAGIAEKIQQKLFDTAADRLTSGLFKLFQFHSGGFVSNYANGGKAGGDVPAMLTSGEYVVRKKVVDRIGTGALDKMNDEGSLEELFNEPNRDNFDLFGGGSNGGNMVSQNFDSGGLVKLLGLHHGGVARLDEYDKKNALSDIGYGVGVGAGAAYAGYLNRDKGNNDDAPEAPMTKGLNTSAALNLGFQDPRLSAKYRQDNQSSQDYGKYLLQKYDYDVNKKNAEEREKAAMLSTIIGTVGMGIGAAVGKKIGNSMADSIVASKLSGGGVKSENGNVMSYSPGKGFSSDKRGVGGEYVGDLNNRFAGYRGASEDVGQSAKGAAKFLREKGFLVGRTGNPLFAAPRPTELVEADKTMACPGGVCPQGSSSKNSLNAVAGSSGKGFNRIKGHSDVQHRTRMVMEGIMGGGPGAYTESQRREIFEYNDLPYPPVPYAMGGIVQGLNAGGRVSGPAGIDKVGPVMLDSGEYVIKSNSVQGIEKDFPGLLDKLNAGGFAEGGGVGDQVAPASSSKTSNSTSNNVTVNISVGANGSASTQVQGQSENQNAEGLGSRLKEAVLGVIASEKRVGGMLGGY